MAQETLENNHREIVYKSVEGDDLVLHVFSVEDKYNNKPVTVFLHPGGWIMGSPSAFFDDCKYYAQEGQVAISVEYKLASFTSRSPMDCLDDVIDALNYIKENASTLNVDMNQLSIVGYSAGAHLALMSQLIPNERVPTAQQLILYSTPVDLSDDKLAPQLIKGDETLASISPITYLRKIPAKISMFHGEKDFMVSFEHAQSFVKQARAIGNDISLQSFPAANHFLLSNEVKDDIQLKTRALLIHDVPK